MDWQKNILQKDKIYCLKCQKLILAYICFNLYLRYIYNKQFKHLKQFNTVQFKYKFIFFVYT